MSYHGDIRLEATIDFHFDTVSTGSVPTTIAGSPVLRAYVDNSSAPITVGLTLDVDFGGVVGSHHVRVVASAGFGFADQTNVTIKLGAGSVGGTSVVGAIVGDFSIGKRGGPIADAVWNEDPVAHLGVTAANQLVLAASAANSVAITVGAAGEGLTALGGMSATMKAQVNAELDTALDETIADSVPADGTRPSARQALYMLTQFMLERSVSSTTVTVRKPDGTTTLFTLSLSDPTSPTAITRAT